MKALVTGATGFIGSSLVEELDTIGFEVFALMRKRSSAANLDGLKYKVIEGDLGNQDSLNQAVQGMDYVFHLAGATTASNRGAYFEANSAGTARLAKAVADFRPQLTRFVYVSSLAAAGPSQSLSPRTETDPDSPVSAYGESKLQGEKEVLAFAEKYPLSIVRPPMVYGPKDKGVFVMIQSVARHVMPILRGSTEGGHKYYSMIYAKDLCRGIVQAGVVARDKSPSGDIFYLCGDGIHTYLDIMTTIAEKLNCDPLRINIPKFFVRAAGAGLSGIGVLTRRTFPLNLDKVNEILPDYWICSNQKAKRVLGFVPEFDLSSGMAQAIEWYKRQKWI
ncbi:MAG: NAD-dependent epimerase/dehydratase family protein [Bdellovibrio sp.]|nr:NAD-dependent epimerase/dehydratase family protein [Bdellovibrio sp.]